MTYGDVVRAHRIRLAIAAVVAGMGPESRALIGAWRGK